MTTIELYQRLAEAHQAQGKYQERDRFLVLALDAAHQAGQTKAADQLRGRILELNPNHLIKPYPSFVDALKSPNFTNYLMQLRKNYPPAIAQALWQEVGSNTIPMPIRPKTGLAIQPSFPSAEAVDDLAKTPTWSQVQIDIRSKNEATRPAPVILQYAGNGDEPMNRPVPPSPPYADPLSLEPAPFALAKQPPAPAVRQPGFQALPGPVPSKPKRISEEIVSPAGALIGNVLFVVMLAGSLMILGYLFVWPLVG